VRLATCVLTAGLLTLPVSVPQAPKSPNGDKPPPLTRESLRGQWEGPEGTFLALEFTAKKATLTNYPNGDGFLGETAEFSYVIDPNANIVKLDQEGTELLRGEPAKDGKLAVTTVRPIRLLPKGLNKALFARGKEKDPRKPAGARADVVAAVEAELTRLSKQAEKETGPVAPPPSREVAYLLLTALAARGAEVKQPAEALRQLGITPLSTVKVQVFTVAADTRIVISSVAIQDKSGYWTSKRATLYRRQVGKWVERGSGLTALDGVESQAEQPVSALKGQKLTPELAKEALLEMMRSKAGRDLGWFNGKVPDEMAKMKSEEEKDGWYGWGGAFHFHPSRAIYTFVVRPQPGVRACAFAYEGSFLRKGGAWSATPPKLVRTALQSGE
jgi:hypothetical protein